MVHRCSISFDFFSRSHSPGLLGYLPPKCSHQTSFESDAKGTYVASWIVVLFPLLSSLFMANMDFSTDSGPALEMGHRPKPYRRISDLRPHPGHHLYRPCPGCAIRRGRTSIHPPLWYCISRLLTFSSLFSHPIPARQDEFGQNRIYCPVT
jgi:hypothetical protein